MLAWRCYLSNLARHAAISLMIKKYFNLFLCSSILFFFNLTCALLVFPPQVFAQTDPSIDWKVLNLPHFRLIYDAKHQELAKIYAKHLESNYPVLHHYFEQMPESTTVVLNDRTDLTNGYATPIPYPHIVLFPVLPGPQETISEYGDWERELVMHEYTHILSFQPRRGLVKALYYTFGSIITPNMLLPRWYLEGIAVDMETRNSDHGRLRSTYQDASLRAYVFDKNLQHMELGQINETDLASWPYGARPYLFGSLMWSEMIARYGESTIEELHHLYGGRFPFFIETPMRETTGSSYQGLFNQTLQSIENRAHTQINQLEKTPLLSGTDIKIKNAIEIFSAHLSPDGLKMAVITKEDDNKRYIRILQRPSTNVAFAGSQLLPKIRLRIDGIKVSWLENSQQIIYERVLDLNRFHEVSEFLIYDLTKKHIQQASENIRGREANLNGNNIVFVKIAAGKTDLALSQLTANNGEFKITTPQILISPPLGTRVSAPLFLNSKEIIFSYKDNQGEGLRIYNLENKSVRNVFTDFSNAKMPSIANNQIVFASTKNGTYNLYAAPLSAINTENVSAKPISHTATTVAQTDWDSYQQEYYTSELTSSGWMLRRFSDKQIRTLPPQLPIIRPMLADRYGDKAANTKTSSVDSEKIVNESAISEYSAAPYLLPHYWLPNISFYNGGSILGGSTAGSDPVGHHSYALAGAYDSGPREFDYQFSYLNNQTSAMLALQALDIHAAITNTYIKFRQQNYLATATWQLSAINTDLYAGLGYHSLLRDFSNAVPSQTEAQGPRVLVAYQDISKSGDQISPETGGAYSLAASHFAGGSGEKLKDPYQQYELSTQTYLSGAFLPKHHVFSIRAQGQMIQQKVSLADGAITSPYQLFNNLPTPYMVMRGYLPGQFLGKSMINTNLEYRFPLWRLEKGSGTSPVFLRRIHGALIADGVALDGYAYDRKLDQYERLANNQSFWSAGAELKIDTTVGFVLPLTFYAGYYLPLSKFKEAQQWAIGIQL